MKGMGRNERKAKFARNKKIKLKTKIKKIKEIKKWQK